MNRNALIQRIVGLVLGVAVALSAGTVVAQGGHAGKSGKKQYRGLLGPDSKKVKTEGDKTYVWAGGPADGPGAMWYDFTGSPIPTAELQFGIGKDRIRAIDDPLFVKPDDPRLAKLPASHYRQDKKHATNDDIMVIGHVVHGEARAYPTALLDHHELVNDLIGGKPVTVGW